MIISSCVHVAAKWCYFLLSYGWVISHCIYATHLYSFICQWALRLFPRLGWMAQPFRWFRFAWWSGWLWLSLPKMLSWVTPLSAPHLVAMDKPYLTLDKASQVLHLTPAQHRGSWFLRMGTLGSCMLFGTPLVTWAPPEACWGLYLTPALS